MAIALGLLVVLPFAFVYTFVFLANTVGIAVLEWANERPYRGEFYVDPVALTVVVVVGLAIQQLLRLPVTAQLRRYSRPNRQTGCRFRDHRRPASASSPGPIHHLRTR